MMKNLKEILYFKRRKSIQLEEDLKQVKSNYKTIVYGFIGYILFLSTIGLFFSHLDNIDYYLGKIVIGSFFAYGFYNIFYELKKLNIENEMYKTKKEIDILFKSINKELEINS